MMANFPITTLIFLAVILGLGIALFIVLGKRIGAQGEKKDFQNLREMDRIHTENEKTMSPYFSGSLPQKNTSSLTPPPLPNHAGLPSFGEKTLYVQPEAGSALSLALFEVQKKVPQFNNEAFFRQMEGCFRSIVMGFAEGNRAALEPVLSQELLALFDGEIEKRLTNGHKNHCIIRRLEKIEIENIEFKKKPQIVEDPEESEEIVEMTLSFISWQVNYQTNRDNKLIDGTQGLTEFRDLWSFTASRSHPVWRLEKTQTCS